MESLTKSEPIIHSSSSSIKQTTKSTIAHCNIVPCDSMKDMDWLNSIELTKLHDSSKVIHDDDKNIIHTNNCYLDSIENEVFEKNTTNLLSFKNIQNIIDKIRAKSSKEKIDIQLLEKLTKILNVSPPSQQHMETNTTLTITPTTNNDAKYQLKDDDDNVNNTTTIEQSPTTPPTTTTTTNHNSDNYVMSDDVRKLLTPKKSPYKGDCVVDEDKLKPLDYKNDHTLKPPYSYSTLIKMAMKSNHKECITLLNIYEWIRTNFAYYRNVDSCWQNSIRHNLSLNKCFVRVPRESGDHGKGGYWRYVESNDTNDSRYPTKMYSRSLSSGLPSLNCYRSKKYHRRNNKNLSVIVQPFDQFQPQYGGIQHFTNNISSPAPPNQFTNQQHNNQMNLYGGYHNPALSPSATTNIYNVLLPSSYHENNSHINNNNNTYHKSMNSNNNTFNIPTATTINNNNTFNIPTTTIINNNNNNTFNIPTTTTINNETRGMPSQLVLPNGNTFDNNQQLLTKSLINIGINPAEVNPILEAMKYPLTYYNNIAQATATNNHNSTNNNNNSIVEVGGVLDRDLTQNIIVDRDITQNSIMDRDFTENLILDRDITQNSIVDRDLTQNLAMDRELTQNIIVDNRANNTTTTSLPILCDTSNRYSIELLNSFNKSSSTASYDILQQHTQDNNNNSISNPLITNYNNFNNNNTNNSLTDNTDISPCFEYKSLPLTNNLSNECYNGNDFYNYYMNELGISQQQQQQKQQINPQIQRLYNVLGENNFTQP